MFKPKNLISRNYDEEFTGNMKVWDDADPKKLSIQSAVITKEVLLLFTDMNGYKINKNKNGKFGWKTTELIPEIQWKNFYISNMKHVYLINEKGTDSNSGLSY